MLLRTTTCLAWSCDFARENAEVRVRRVVTWVARDGQSCWTSRGQREIGGNVRISDCHGTSTAKKYPLPDSCIAVSDERNVQMLLCIMVTEIFPIDPIQPTVG